MAKKKKTRRSRKFTLPISIVAGLAPGIGNVWAHRSGGVAEMGAEASRIYVGYASTNKYGYNDTIGFHPYLLSYGTVPLIAGVLVHWIAGKIGLNRKIASSGIPVIRI